MVELIRDGNRITVAGGQSSTDATAVLPFKIDPVTGRLLTDTASAGSGTVTSVSVVSANGFAGTVATATTTPAITLSTSITGLLKGNGTAISAATAGTDYIVPTTAFTAGSVAFGGATNKLSQDNANLFWDDTNNFFGIGSAVPLTPLWVHVGTGQNFIARTTGARLQIGSLADDANSYTGLQLDGSTIYLGFSGGKVSVGSVTPTALLHLSAGTIAANTAPLKLTSGPLLTTAEAGAVEFLTDAFYGTITTGAARKTFAFLESPSFTTPALGTPSSGVGTNITGIPAANILAGSFGAGAYVISTSLQATTIELGAATDTTLARVSAGVISVEGSTVGMLPTAQTWTGQNKFNNIVDVNNAIAASGNAATVPVTFRLNTVTNNSAATLTITMTTASAVDGQMTMVRILDASAVAQTITWVNTENSAVTAPTTSNGSTTLFLTVGFIYNGATSKWRCIASA